MPSNIWHVSIHLALQYNMCLPGYVYHIKGVLYLIEAPQAILKKKRNSQFILVHYLDFFFFLTTQALHHYITTQALGPCQTFHYLDFTQCKCCGLTKDVKPTRLSCCYHCLDPFVLSSYTSTTNCFVPNNMYSTHYRHEYGTYLHITWAPDKPYTFIYLARYLYTLGNTVQYVSTYT